MLHKIKREDLMEGRIVAFHASTAITAAAICQGLTAYILMEMSNISLPDGEGLKGEIGTSGDRWLGGALLLSIEVAEVVDGLLDYDAYVEGEGCCVFTYDHCEVEGTERFHSRNDLPAHLMRVVEPMAWYDMSENWQVPKRPAIEAVFREWAGIVGVPLKEAEYANHLVPN